MQLSDYRPRPALVRHTSTVLTPRFPVIDAHNHLGDFGGGWAERSVAEFLKQLDQVRVQLYIDLDGGWGESILQVRLDTFKAKAPERYMVFGGVAWEEWATHGDRFGEWAAARLREQARWGAQGLKIWKPFGLYVRDHRGQRVAVNDPRLAPLWETAGELHLPVMVHVADPVAFFDPLDATNERWEELHAHPDWQFPSPPFPPFLGIMEEFAALVRTHPHTTFIGAHVGCYAENLDWVARLIEECPNFYVDISARIGELGRQPYTARAFFNAYADRILFGLDMGPHVEAYQLYYRFLESDDEYFNYSLGDIPTQGRWHIYGLFLPDEVLAKVYYQNAQHLFQVALPHSA